MDTRPSRDIDARARARAAKRYRQAGDDWVKGKEVGGAWVPDAASQKFASLPEAVEHEMSLTKQRRTSWTNLIKGQTAAVKEHVTADGEKTRAEVRAGLAPLVQLLGPDDDIATAAQLRMRKATMGKLYQERINEVAAQERAAKKRPRTEGAAGSSSDDRINEVAAQERAAKKRPRTEGAAGSSSDDRARFMRPACSAAAAKVSRAAPPATPEKDLRLTDTTLQDKALRTEIDSNARNSYLPAGQALALLDFCKELLPSAQHIHTGRFKHSSKPSGISRQCPKIVCADKDAAGCFYQYEFANFAPQDYSMLHSPIQGTPLQPLLQQLVAEYGCELNHIVINCYASLADYIPSHKDQAGSQEAKASYETEASTFIYSLNAPRTLSYIKDSGDSKLWGKARRGDVACVLHDVQLEHNSLHVLTGRVNTACLHAVFAGLSQSGTDELRFSITVRGVRRLWVDALKSEYQLWKHGRWQPAKKIPSPTRQIPDATATPADSNPINEPNDAALSSNGTANGVAMFVAPPPSDAAPGESDLDELAARLVDEDV